MTPIYYTWNGEEMKPLARFAKACDRYFVVGQVYPLEIHEQRSQASHNQFFASVHEAWLNLPEDTAERFPTEHHLRKWALIKAGYADERSIVCSSKTEAQRIAAFIKPMDDYAIVAVRDATIKVFTAKSQSQRAMGKKDFQESKQKVLDIIAGLLNVKADDLSTNAGQAA